MQQLLGDTAGPNLDNTFLRELFLQRLPNHVRMDLASAGDMPLEALATLADKVMQVASPSVYSVNVAPLTSEAGQLRSQVAQLREMIAALKVFTNPQHRACSYSRSIPTSGSRSSSPAPTASKNTPPACLCWYYRRFGDTALKCTSPYSWMGNSQAGC